MGEVWKAWDPELNRWVALKFVKVAAADDLARFEREARLAARLTHPHIAAIYEFGDDSGSRFIAMQYIEGRTLRSWIRGEPKRVVTLLRDAALAVQEAHRLGIIHRDLKPDNLMATFGNHLYVMDFGLARPMNVESSISMSGFVVGTPSYMPPEQARGDAVDERGDVYGLGATLYELLTGAKPFEASGVYDTLMKVIMDEPRPLRTLDPSIDRDLETIVMKCLEKDRARRYPTAAALAAELDRWLKGEPIEARAPSAIYVLGKKLARRRGLVAAAVAAAVIVLLTPAILVPLLRKTESQAAGGREALLKRMRETSSVCLEAALEKRRAKDLKGMRSYLGQVKAACEAVAAKEPGLAEPHYLLGRMHRVLFDEESALREQEEALKREPTYAPALYERVLLLGGEALSTGNAAVQRLLEARVAVLGRRSGKVEFPDWNDTLRADARGRALLDRIQADLQAITAGGETGLGEGDLLCARGWLAYLRSDPSARSLLEMAIARDPRLAEALRLLIELEIEAGNVSKALELLARGLELDPGYIIFWSRRAEIRVRQSRLAYLRGESDDEFQKAALDDVVQVTLLDPGDSDFWRLRGVLEGWFALGAAGRGQDASGQLAAAIASFARSMELSPDHPLTLIQQAHLQAGIAYERAKRGESPVALYGAQLKVMSEATERLVNDDEGWICLGTLHTHWAEWLSTHGEDPVPMYRMALEEFAQARRITPGNLQSRACWAMTSAIIAQERTRRGDPEVEAICRQAIADMNDLLDFAPGMAQGWMRGAQLQIALGDSRLARGADALPTFEAALRSLGQAEEQLKGSEDYWLLAGSAHLRLAQNGRADHFAKAVDCFERGAKLAPQPARSLLLRAGALMDQYHLAGEDESLLAKAERDIDRAMEINPKHHEIWRARGMLRLSQGQARADHGEDPIPWYEKAVADLTKSLEINKRNENTRMQRGLVHLTIAQRSRAAPSYQAALDDFEAAIEINPEVRRGVAEYMRECREALGK